MSFRKFRRNYHDSHLAKFTLGPRREVQLEIALDSVWNKEGPAIVQIRLGGIENYEEVSEFFAALITPPMPDAYIAEIIGLQFIGSGPNWVVVDLEKYGHVRIQSRNVTEG